MGTCLPIACPIACREHGGAAGRRRPTRPTLRAAAVQERGVALDRLAPRILSGGARGDQAPRHEGGEGEDHRDHDRYEPGQPCSLATLGGGGLQRWACGRGPGRERVRGIGEGNLPDRSPVRGELRLVFCARAVVHPAQLRPPIPGSRRRAPRFRPTGRRRGDRTRSARLGWSARRRLGGPVDGSLTGGRERRTRRAGRRDVLSRCPRLGLTGERARAVVAQALGILAGIRAFAAEVFAAEVRRRPRGGRACLASWRAPRSPVGRRGLPSRATLTRWR